MVSNLKETLGIVWKNFIDNLTLTQMCVMSTFTSTIALILVPKLVLVLVAGIVLLASYEQAEFDNTGN